MAKNINMRNYPEGTQFLLRNGTKAVLAKKDDQFAWLNEIGNERRFGFDFALFVDNGRGYRDDIEDENDVVSELPLSECPF